MSFEEYKALKEQSESNLTLHGVKRLEELAQHYEESGANFLPYSPEKEES
ncbi:hypothetical protein [Bacillus sp. FJAT-44742]|nr:hypothetical protein [Bacillus sp. FJAT-44742]